MVCYRNNTNYWIYIIIGMDLDSMSPMGGTDYLRLALDICNNADGLGNDGWKAFGDTKNRFAIVNDYLDGSMEKFRQLLRLYDGIDADQLRANMKYFLEAIMPVCNQYDIRNQRSIPFFFRQYAYFGFYLYC